MLNNLTTTAGEALQGTPWTVHPRPQMKRQNWLSLNGEWEFSASPAKPENYQQVIQVPFCPESQLSGIGRHFEEGMPLWYHRLVWLEDLPAGWEQGRVLLHFGAVDQIADVYVDGNLVGHHEGGYEAFTVDITGSDNGSCFDITVRCTDDLHDRSFPYGKQVMNRGGMWYTPVSGIWQTVWLEFVPEDYIQWMELWPTVRGIRIQTSGFGKTGTITVKDLGTYPLIDGTAVIEPENPRLWSPEDPYLYEFTLEYGEDRIESYFALRHLCIKKVGKYPRLCLNGKPYFFHGLLDQGYWPDGILTPASPECYADDIRMMKKLGFNTLRKHIKVEPEEFYYQCDRMGMIVFQDMVNNGDYHFLRDTALPTVGVQKLDDTRLHADPAGRRRFLEGMKATVKQLHNHPSICCWTIFNEGWGQFDSDHAYEQLRILDDTRFIDSTSGWFRREKTDVDSRHVYFRKVKLKGDEVKPLVLSEFGGKTFKVEGHVFNPDKSYGYGGCDSLEALNDAVAKLYMEEVLPCVRNGLCAAIYTQVSDVEDEINGLVTYDRKVEKMNPEKLLPIAAALQQAVEE